jgi:hypothetical protein
MTGQVFTDQTGKFVVPSTAGHNYVMILYDYDGNSINSQPMKSRTAQEHVKAYQALHTMLVKRGLRPKLQRLDNECSTLLKEFFDDEAVDFQLTPAGDHRRNNAERAIRTWKNHFIAILSGCDPDFPLALWHLLLPQTDMTLNMLRTSRINPRLSAYEQLQGRFNFDRTPLGPLGTKVIAHERPEDRGSWAPHGVDGWYTGPAMDHYRQYKVWVTDTRAERVSQTLVWFPKWVPLPRNTSNDYATIAALELVRALKNPSAGGPLPPLPDEQLEAMLKLAEIFHRHSTSTKMDDVSAQRVAKNPESAPQQPTRATYANSTKKKQPPPYEPQHHHKTRFRTKYFKAMANAIEKIQAKATNFGAIYCGEHQHERLPRPAPDIMEAHAVIDPLTGAAQEYRHLIKGPDAARWALGNDREIGRLTDGRVGGDDIKGTNTMEFIHWSQLPAGRKATYLRVVADYRPQKADPYRVRWTVGGDKIDYPGVVATPTADMQVAKLLFNSTISTPGAKFMCLDVKDFYLNTPMDRPEYMWVPITLLSQEVQDKYELADKIKDGRVLVEITKGMYGLPQAGRLAYDKLKAHLAPYGYHPAARTPGLWTHDTRRTVFTLCVDDFGIRYSSQDDAQHLINAIQSEYKTTIDWSGSLYCGITLDWNYEQGYVDLSMPGYVKNALVKFRHCLPDTLQHAPSHYTAPIYGSKVQYETTDTTAPLDADGTSFIQQISGTFLFYARAVDPTMRHALSSLSQQQAAPTESTQQEALHFLDYAASHPDATIRYRASDMVLAIHSDASYLSEPQARSRAGGHFWLTDMPSDPLRQPQSTDAPLHQNGPVHTECRIMKHVLASAAEAECGALHHNASEACGIRTALHEMGHPQPPTSIQVDNSTAAGIANQTVKQRRSKSNDMKFYWIQDRILQDQFRVFWNKGLLNLADYFTKHHPIKHHREMRKVYLQTCAEVHFARAFQLTPATASEGVLIPGFLPQS